MNWRANRRLLRLLGKPRTPPVGVGLRAAVGRATHVHAAAPQVVEHHCPGGAPVFLPNREDVIYRDELTDMDNAIRGSPSKSH